MITSSPMCSGGRWLVQAATWTRAVVLLACLFPEDGLAQAAAERSLNPQRYFSASRRYSLNVDPVNRFGEGSADYRLEQDGAAVWAARLPFSLRETVVAEDGTVAGYSYSSGLQGGEGVRGDKGSGSLRLVILAPRDGHARLNEKIERKSSMMMHAPPVPTVEGLLLDEPGDRFIARLAGEKAGETWHVHRLSDGRKLGVIAVATLLPNPGKFAANFPSAVRMLPGAPLTLFQWGTAGASKDTDAHFALLDLDDHRLAWSTNFEADYAHAPEESGKDDAAQRALDRLGDRADRAILTTGPATPEGNCFSLWTAARHQRIDYRVTHAPHGTKPAWIVAEAGTAPLDAPAPDPTPQQTGPLLALPDTPDTPLKPTSVFQFPIDGPPPPAVRSVRNFCFDGQGCIGLLRVEGSHAAFVLADPKEKGAVRREIELPMPDLAACTTHLAWLENSRWLLIAYKNATDSDWEKSGAWTLDAGTSTIAPWPEWDRPAVKGVSGVGDGRFVTLEQRFIHSPDHTTSMPESLTGFDRTGRRQWVVEENDDVLFSPEDVAVLSDGKTAAVVETIRNDVLIFGLADGKLQRTVHLKKAWGREPTYPAEIAADQDGGFIVGDWQNPTASYVRARADGQVRAALTPRYADGSPVDGGGIPMRADPAGNVWMSDRDSLLRLDARGRVDLVLGEPRESTRLGAIGEIAVGDDGHLYAVGARTGNVYVFDESGREQHVCRPDRKDVPDRADTFNIAVAPDRHVFLGMGRYGLAAGDYDSEPAPQIEFGADGQRLGARQLHLGANCQGWQFVSGGARRLLATAFSEARLIDAATAKTIRLIDRQFDRRWLDQIGSRIACAPDGRFVVCSALQDEYSERVVNFFDTEGNAFRKVRMPATMESDFIAYDGQRFVTRQKGTNRLLVFNVDEGMAPRGYTVELPAGSVLDDSWEPFVVKGARELWLVCCATKTVARFAWPP